MDEYSRVDDFPWNREIRTASLIEVSVHGWDGLFTGPDEKDAAGKLKAGWAESPRAKAWKQFFANDGTLTLILPRIPNGAQSSEINEVSTRNLEVIARRTGKDLASQVSEIEATISLAESLQIEVDKGRVNHHYVTDLRWICSARFDDNLILLSTYTTQRRKPATIGGKRVVQTVSGEFRGPAFSMDPMIYSSVQEWIHVLHRRDVEEPNLGITKAEQE
ncbi:hypothetical protein JOD60_000408 [Microbacterium aurum]|uniref:hypothetical protein n=1 Tax=Microbacterium aurum TaxID=36805 RepID=UPI00195B76A9|nr:hypothetical protein [Microbacterium aurum]MBM7826350.1 hypothetical protein [Microbacterium aurum]